VKLEYRSPTPEELESVLRATFSAFGEEMTAEEFAHEGRLMPVDRVLAAWHEGRPVGTAASWPFEITVPGGASLPAAGVTWCGVLPTHRRRGVLSRLMRAQLEDVHARGEPLALLWASEAPIYGRFGYGVAAPETTINAERGSFALRDASKPAGTVRLVSADEAVEVLPPLYESRRSERPGSLSRSADWWRHRLLADPKHWRRGSGPKFCATVDRRATRSIASNRSGKKARRAES
jgi:predicted N-acetyltransferase YhbS